MWDREWLHTRSDGEKMDEDNEETEKRRLEMRSRKNNIRGRVQLLALIF